MAEPHVAMGAMLQCSFGVAPCSLVVLPSDQVLVEEKPAANISASAPLVNIPTFGMCMSLANPEVAAAHRGRPRGADTHALCARYHPVGFALPDDPRRLPAVVMGSTCQCAFGGVINITFPGSTIDGLTGGFAPRSQVGLRATRRLSRPVASASWSAAVRGKLVHVGMRCSIFSEMRRRVPRS